MGNRRDEEGKQSSLQTVMKIPFALLLIVAPVLAGPLPTTNKQPWVAYYAGYQRKDFHFTINVEGTGELLVYDAKGKPITARNSIKFLAVIEETGADGKVVQKPAVRDGWEAVTPAAIDPGKITIRGTSSGESRFEVNFEFNGDEIRAGGKLLDKGKLKNPRFVLRVAVPNVYSYDKDLAKLDKKAEEDRIDLVRVDGKKLKLGSRKAMDAESAEVSGTGVAEARIEMAGLPGHKFEFEAGASAAFELWNKDAGPLSEGFSLLWKPDAAKDPEGKGRMVLKVK
jgi:hypothetical protein